MIAKWRILVETGPAAFGRAGGDSRHWAAAVFLEKDREMGIAGIPKAQLFEPLPKRSTLRRCVTLIREDVQ